MALMGVSCRNDVCPESLLDINTCEFMNNVITVPESTFEVTFAVHRGGSICLSPSQVLDVAYANW